MTGSDRTIEPVSSPASTSLRRAGLTRWLCIGATGASLGIAVALLIGNVAFIEAHWGEDFGIYLRHTREWIAGGSFYDARQLTGSPYTLAGGDSLYPPPFALVMLPFLVLPGVLWWALPAVTVGAVIRHHRPAPWTWPILALCIASPRTLGLLVYGNPSMWLAASVALATIWGWLGVFAFLKPSLAFFALAGIRTRAWWIAAGILALSTIVMLPDWRGYLTVLRNLQGIDVTYSLMDVPLVGIALVAWVGRTRTELAATS